MLKMITLTILHLTLTWSNKQTLSRSITSNVLKYIQPSVSALKPLTGDVKNIDLLFFSTRHNTNLLRRKNATFRSSCQPQNPQTVSDRRGKIKLQSRFLWCQNMRDVKPSDYYIKKCCLADFHHSFTAAFQKSEGFISIHAQCCANLSSVIDIVYMKRCGSAILTLLWNWLAAIMIMNESFWLISSQT